MLTLLTVILNLQTFPITLRIDLQVFINSLLHLLAKHTADIGLMSYKGQASFQDVHRS